jgi:hypothetical protein
MKPAEIVGAHMPWAVAWSADRRADWLPAPRSHYNGFRDYKMLGGPINAIYLTALLGLESECIFFPDYHREKSGEESTK